MENSDSCNKKVSVVIPIYNVEKYLDRCLNSVVGQTYGNLEIILVDDGSPDRCPQMCEEWAVKDQRIKVVHKKNAGLGMARNTGIENASGEYICFFDSDDYIHPETIAHSIALAEEKNAQVVFFGMHTVNQQGDIIRKSIPKSEISCYCGSRVLEEMLPSIISPSVQDGKIKNIVPSAWSCLFSMELIKRANWRFVSEREIISEDIYSMLDLFRNVNSAAVLREALYYYCENNSSLTHVYRPERFAMNKKFYRKCIELCTLHDYPPIVIKNCASPFLGNIIGTMKQVVANSSTIRDALHRIRIILDDLMVQEAIQVKRGDPDKKAARLLFWTMRNKQALLCYVLLKIKISLTK